MNQSPFTVFYFLFFSFSVDAITLCSDPWFPYIQGQINDEAQGGRIVELEKQLFQRLGYKEIKFPLINWARCLHQAKLGLNDGVMMLFKKPERQKYLVFSESIMTTRLVVLYSTKYSPSSIDWKDPKIISNKVIGIVRGNSYGAEFDLEMKKGNYIIFEIKDEISSLQMLSHGRLDLTIMNEVIANQLIIRLKLEGSVVAHPETFLIENQYIGISKLSPLAARIDDINKELKQINDEQKKNLPVLPLYENKPH